MAQTLEELKAENAKEEAEAALSSDQNVEDDPQEEVEANDEAVETEAEESEEVAETESEEAEEVETEAWMQGDEPGSQDVEKKYTGADIGKAKQKFKAKLEKKHNEETERLQARINELEASQATSKVLNKPSRDDFDDEDAYLDAYYDWKAEKQSAAHAAKAKEADQLRQAKEYKNRVSTGVDQHYERAVELSEKSGISPELYQSADLMVRQAVESVFPEAGDAITDAMIANLGSGSEKVFYHLGVNSTKREEFKNLLKSDSSGMKAAMFLGTLKSDLEKPSKRKTNAPKPSPNIESEVPGGDVAKKFKRQYQKADKDGDVQARFNARRQARAAGVDVSDW